MPCRYSATQSYPYFSTFMPSWKVHFLCLFIPPGFQGVAQPEARLSVNDSMDVVVSVFDRTHAWTLPVVDADGVFVGFIRKSSVLTVYRQMLADFSND